MKKPNKFQWQSRRSYNSSNKFRKSFSACKFCTKNKKKSVRILKNKNSNEKPCQQPGANPRQLTLDY